jgi:cellulose 1,4-beta-cellobiosidase
MSRLNSSVLGLAVALGLGFGVAACAGAMKPVAVVPATTPHAPTDLNPFAGARMYVNPEYNATVKAMAERHADQAPLLKKLADMSTAIWLSKIADLALLPKDLDDALAEQTAGGKPVVPVFVVYDMPGRDCAAAASAGELGANEAGEARYQKEYVDVIAAALAAHPTLNAVLILEPDSLYKDVLAMAGGPDRIRGFAVDVSNYDPAKDPTAPKRDPAAAPNDELGYIEDLAKALPTVGITGKAFVIDTSRDGVPSVRTEPGNWCNIKGAGLGERPQAAPAPNVDAYLWIKVPGESDGTADAKAARFDANCVSDDATPGAPEAGLLFEPYLLDLVKNAKPPL